MAATKRKTIRKTARKAGKKSMRSKRPTRARKMSRGTTSVRATLRLVRTPPITSVSKPFTKGQLFTALAGRTGLQRRDITSFFDELKAIILAHVKKQGPGQFTIPGLVKLTVVHKPATKARKGINPFTGQEMMFKAKPSRYVVKARALKQLKSMV